MGEANFYYFTCLNYIASRRILNVSHILNHTLPVSSACVLLVPVIKANLEELLDIEVNPSQSTSLSLVSAMTESCTEAAPAKEELPTATTSQPHLSKQDLNKLQVSELTPLTPEVISRQATINIGTIGHVAHGKSTVVKAISGVQTVRFKNELIRNITIKLGYANAKIYKCNGAECSRPNCYR